MKKSTIVLLCVGAVLLVLGGCTFLVTYSMGAVGYEGDFPMGRHESGYYYDGNSYDQRETYTYGGKVYENKALSLEGKNAQFTQVELQLGAADATITQDGGPGYVSVENFPEEGLSLTVSDGRLTVEDLSGGTSLHFAVGRSKQQRKLLINLPADVKLRSITLDCGAGDLCIQGISSSSLTVTGGAGSLSMENVSVGGLSLSSGAGDWVIRGLSCKGGADISWGAGDIDITGADIEGDVQITGGVGDLELAGLVKGDISMKIGAGDCDLELLGKAGDYYFTLEKGAGDIEINDIEFSRGQKVYGQPNAPYSVDIQGGAGDIDVEFKQ